MMVVMVTVMVNDNLADESAPVFKSGKLWRIDNSKDSTV